MGLEPDEHTKDVYHHEERPVLGPSANFLDLASVRREDIPILVQQLQVQHVQLEMQNEELRQAQETPGLGHYHGSRQEICGDTPGGRCGERNDQ